MTFCSDCREHFGSTGAFDEHRIGSCAYTYAEGLDMDPPREDGRRCLDPTELREHGWYKNGLGHWRKKRFATTVRLREARGGHERVEQMTQDELSFWQDVLDKAAEDRDEAAESQGGLFL